MFEKIKAHVQKKKHAYTVVVCMVFVLSGTFAFSNILSTGNGGDEITMEQVAQVSYTPLNPLPGIDPVINTGNTIGYLQKIIFLVIGIAIVLAVLMLVIGGVQYMASDAFTSKEDAKDRMTMAMFGLIIALGAYLLLNTINPDLVTFKLPSRGGIDIKTVLPQQSTLDSVRSGSTIVPQVERKRLEELDTNRRTKKLLEEKTFSYTLEHRNTFEIEEANYKKQCESQKGSFDAMCTNLIGSGAHRQCSAFTFFCLRE